VVVAGRGWQGDDGGSSTERLLELAKEERGAGMGAVEDGRGSGPFIGVGGVQRQSEKAGWWQQMVGLHGRRYQKRAAG
jgi:hypothetical protein